MQTTHILKNYLKMLILIAAFAMQMLFIQSAFANSKHAYVIAEVTISNHEGYENVYRPLINKLYDSKAGGVFLSRGGHTKNVMGEQLPSRVNLIMFESLEKAVAFYASEEYKYAIDIGKKFATFRINIIEGTNPK